ncbi:MAG: hypothetical protein ACI8RD_014036 [Bacillariaceae sp.]|jgi:hypothetical protein
MDSLRYCLRSPKRTKSRSVCILCFRISEFHCALCTVLSSEIIRQSLSNFVFVSSRRIRLIDSFDSHLYLSLLLVVHNYYSTKKLNKIICLFLFILASTITCIHITAKVKYMHILLVIVITLLLEEDSTYDWLQISSKTSALLDTTALYLSYKIHN